MRPPSFFGRRREPRTRINQFIRVPEVRVIGSGGEQLGVIPTRQAQQMAQDEGLDLVEVAATARPPVCKIMDFGKYKYEQDKQKREARKKQTVVHIKEIKIRPSTDRHDLDVKLKHIRRFLEEGNKAKITVRFRGREMAHKDLGMALLKQMVDEIGALAKIDQGPKFEGKMLSAVLAPNPGGKRNAKNENQAGG
ncbi:MAG: translation initiation factor IF-3 [Deltaproteobacteria bacterium]|nr:translation initiation factor IF-3 [Deltaproteobacteria bacterium]